MGNETKSRFRLGSKISSIVLSVAMLATTFTGLGSTLVPQTSITVNAARNYGLADNIQDGNILHCFCWKYDDIKDMLPEIAEAGFTSVQVSPPQATAGTGAWWWFYQPLGFYIGSNAMGNEQSLKALCSEAHNYGIKIIADVVANHLAGDHSNIQDDLKDGQYWHSEQYNADDGDRYRVTHGKIGMPDLATENSHVQDCVIKYLAQLKSAGVDGIRFDAAKHIGLPSEGDQFWARVTASTDLWSYGEILNNPGISLDEGASTRQQAINVMKEYSNYIGITDSVYGKLLRDELAKGKFPDSPSVYAGAWMGIANTRLVYWGESHDTWSNNDDWGSSRNVDQNVIDRAYAIAGSRNHIAALYLSRPFSKDKDSIMIGAKGSTHFTSKEVAAVNHYKNALNGQDDYYTTGGGCGVVCRAGGAVVALASGGNTDVTVPNGGGTVTPGTYTDEISGSTWTVTATQMTGHIGESGIAVFYKGGAVGGSVSATPGNQSFEENTLSVTLNCTDATNTTYSTSEGASGSFTDGQKITIGASTAQGSSVTLTVKGTAKDGSALSETYTYKKVKAGEKVYIYMDNSSYNWSSVYAYVYDESSGTAKEMAKWPGTKLTDKNSKGYFKLDVTAYKDNGQVIFSDGTNSDANRYPADKMPGMKIAGSSKLFGAGNKWADYSDVVIPPTTDPDVTVDKASGTSFTTETLDITLSLANATKGTYSIDNGPTKEFTKTTKVTIGEGKIADTDVTVKVTATDGSKTTNKTLTYSKKYVKKTTSTSASLANVYKTNPTGLGKEATITIDGDASDWSEDMLIAQGAAWDVANHWKGGHENCVLDTYALFAAWDDTNLYIGWQMVNTTDTWANPGDGPLSDGGRVLDVPLILALSLSSSSVGMTNKNTAGGSIWGQKMGLTFTTHVDRLFYMSGKPGLGKPSMFAAADAQGNTDYDPPYCVGFADGGIEYKMATTNICSKIIGLNSSDDPADVFDNSADWVDYKTMNHDTKYDSFYEIKIPLATLGITKDYITSNGIGAMLVATRGESALDCIPYDPSMVDNAKGDYSADPSTSEEKEDIDNITVPLACIGKGEIGGGDDIIIPTPDTLPLQVNFGTDRSAPQLSTTALTIKGIGYGGTAPYKYEFSVDGKVVKASNTTATVSWKPTTNGQHTLKCVITDSTGKTATATKTFTSEGGGDIIIIDELLNNSSLSSTSIAAGGSITMKGAASGGTSPYQYTYLYKSSSASSWTTVKAYSTTTSVSATISAAGSYQACIKVKDSTGTEVKKFIDFTVTGGSSLVNNSTVSATTVTLGKAVTVKGAALGGKSPYKYAFFYKASSTSTWTTKQDFSTTSSVSITFTGAGTKDICVKVKDNSGTIVKKYFTVTVKASGLTNNSTVSATSIALGSTIKATAKATGGTAPYTYQIVYKKSTQSSWQTASAYGTTATANIKPASTGAYQICIKVKDKTGTEVKKFFDITVKAALVNKSTLSATSIKLGDTVTAKGAATGGSGYYNFAVLYKKTADSTWATAQAYKSNTTVTFKPAKATTYDVCIKVKDSANTEVKKYFTLKVTSAAALVNNSTVSATSVKLGNSITVKGAATGGTAPYKYAFFYKASSASTWTTKQDFSTTASVSIKFTGTGTKDVCVKVKDNAGTIVKKYFTVKVTNAALANNSTVSATSVALGNSVTVKCAATGGTSPYKYAIFYKASSSDTWSTKQDFSSTTSASIKFTGKGTKDICVKVKDNAGTVVKKYFTVTVK